MPASTTAPIAPSGPLTIPTQAVSLEGIWHRFHRQAGSGWVLQGLDLALGQGELLGLLGPSGCGKTTLLRLIAGLERPERGTVRLGGRPVAGAGHWLAPERRGVGMVFQDYALFPHLTAWQNAGFGLGGGRRRLQAQDRLRWLLDLVGLAGLADRYPHELSGGQRQRLALVRALAPSPSVLLLDEPFSNLDVEVRRHLRSELPALLRACGTSGVLVTHDPEEALAICDRIAVLKDGVLQQCASPAELLRHPANPFVGRFVLQANLLPAQRLAAGRLSTPCGDCELIGPQEPGSGPSSLAEASQSGKPVEVMVACDGLSLIADADGPAEITGRECLGRSWMLQLKLGSLALRSLVPIEAAWLPGDRCRVVIASGADLWAYPGGGRWRPI